MDKKKPPLARLLKNILQFGGLFLLISFVVDWYHSPTAPTQFEQQVLYDIQHKPKIIAQLSYQKPILLYFWGSWCHYCKVVSPNIQQFVDEGIEVLGIAIQSGDEVEVKNYLNKNGYSFPTLNDPTGDISRNWGIQVTPTILIIKNGKVIHHTTGYTSYLSLKLRLWISVI